MEQITQEFMHASFKTCVQQGVTVGMHTYWGLYSWGNDHDILPVKLR